MHLCAGVYAMVDSLPLEMRSGSGQASKLGTISHFLLETCLSGLVEPESYQGRLIQIADEGTDEEHCVLLKPRAKMPRGTAERANCFEVDSEVVANVGRAYDYVERRCKTLGISMKKLKLETRTNPVPDRDDTSGTADVTLDAWPLALEVLDFKNGRVVVEHKNNPQVLAYLAGKAHDEGWDYSEYWVTIVQPNGRHEEGVVRSVLVTKAELLAFVEKHRAAAERADEAAEAFPGWKAVPTHKNSDTVALKDPKWSDSYLKGGDHCGYCDASHVCPAYRAFRQKQAKEEEWDTDPETGEVEVPDLKAFRFTALQDALEVRQREGFYRSLLRKAHAFLSAEAQAGRLPPGMKWVRKISKRQWKLDLGIPDAVADRIVKGGYLSANERARVFAAPSLITGVQALALVPKGKRADFEEAFLFKPKGGLKLVLATDPGEPVPYSIGDDFENDEESDE